MRTGKLAYLMREKVQENYRADIKEMQNLHKSETDKMTEAINNNNILLQRILDRLDKEGDDK